MFTLRLATVDDVAHVLPRTAALNAHESIDLEPAALEASLRTLLRDPALGRVWLIARDGAPVGYAITTFGYDLEFNGLEAWLTELWIDDHARAHGGGGAVLDLLAGELKALGIAAVHLQVRPENRARRLYERRGFEASPRIVMTRRL
ncbi:MAG TPA: GNAT family N-acetyltransferase [Kofleriaceae bacterium]|nr:GNAT family N-acetyltransferase [Kofleriaceae bacterium]